ncbi:type II toxin-antitoxin system VapC family toxin [Mycobacterium helveticum]|uniref:Ribonuclease VapC n=1 Tax=Mycobacterium helveticum TaxID=2592811 RepID=A0A557XZP3_9MYCO|nr:type II toxin-antitoxin system VapC family toxin [Mycobacterium helveticum]TVS89615.1 type II toxin-antitoxin system VapC family toxin [Mycobacterium helveticum]TVS91688.1 type II toxin-antitoxin system VapC family toxin [Mycobacterium helveticum]
MIAPHTSVLAAGFATWHEGHASAVRTLNRGVHLIAHTALETYSVLARLPPPHRVEAVIVSAYPAGITSGDYLTLDSESRRGLIDHLAARGVTGGATYAALIGWTAKLAGATVLTRDVLRAAFELVA